MLGVNLACIDNMGFEQRREDIELALTSVATKAGTQFTLSINGAPAVTFDSSVSKELGGFDVSCRQH